MASLVEQIYMQSQGGSAQGQGFGQFFAQGLQGGLQLGGQMQEQQRINMAERQLTAELALQPLKQTLLQQQTEIGAAQMATALEERQATVNNAQAFQDLLGQVATLLKSDQPELAQAAILDASAKNYGLWRHQGMKDLFINTGASLASKLALQQAKSAANRLEGVGVDVVTDPQTGRKITFARTGPNSFTEIQGTGDLTTATKTDLQKQELSNDEALRTLGEAISSITATPSAIGVRGKVGQFMEQAKGQISNDTGMATPITDTRQKAAIAFSRVAPALRVDSGNMSKYELNKLEQAGDVLGAEEAPATAVRKLKNLQDAVVARQLRVDKVQGKRPTDATLRSISGDEITGLLQAGLLSKEDAMRLYQLIKADGR